MADSASQTPPPARVPGRGWRRLAIGFAVFVVLLGVLGFLVAPPLIRGTAERELAAALARPVSIERVALNPYTLALEFDGLRIAEPDGAAAFVTLGHFRVRPSWSSLFRLKPVIASLRIEALQVQVIRTAPNRFNFSDLVERYGKPAEPAQPSGPMPQFAVSDIRIIGSALRLDDRVLGERHAIERLNLQLPFIANIPARIDSAIAPHLDAQVDGTPLVLDAEARPFAASLASSLRLRVDGLDLPKLLGYLPVPLPVKLERARLSTDLLLRFERGAERPSVTLSGTVDVAPLAVTLADGSPLAEAARIHLAADVIEPLLPRAELAELRIERPQLSLARDARGRLVLPAVAASPAAPQPQPQSEPQPKAQAADAATAPLPELSLKALRIEDGALRFADAAVRPATTSRVEGLSVQLDQFSTRAEAPATLALRATLLPAATLALDAQIVVPRRQLDAKLAVQGFALPALQPYLAPVLAARLASGRLALDVQAKADASGATPQLNLTDSRVEIADFRLLDGARRDGASLGFKRLAVTLEALDLDARQANVAAIELDGLNANLARLADGTLDIARFARSQPATKAATRHATPPAAAAGAIAANATTPRATRKASAAARPRAGTATPAGDWHWRVGRVAISNAAAGFTDRQPAQPVVLKLAGLSLKTGAISDDARRPLDFDFATRFQRDGRLAARGALSRAPLAGRVTLRASALDLASFAPYIPTGINATLASARLRADGEARFAQAANATTASWKGELGLAQLRLLDPESSEPFAGFGDLALGGIAANWDRQRPVLRIDKLALSDFFAQVLLDAKGRLNIGRIIATGDGKAEPATAAPDAASPATASTSAGTPPATSTPTSVPAAAKPVLQIGEIQLARGNIDYTDNFIQPNFRANLTEIGGSIGTLATDASEPAPVAVRASLDGNGPVTIDGKVNPLAATPMIDLAATARDIELTRFAAYSAKYTGYPIVKGKLQVDLRYALADGQLKANNHVFIDQFTFGERVDGPSATSLPVRLAISLLKNARGEIDINLPVSGSLSDPKFSVGGIIWSAVLNLLEKAATSPFRLLAGAFSGGGDDGGELGDIEFAAGSAMLDAPQATKLEQVAKLLGERPQLKLDLTAHARTEDDLPALRERAVDRQVRQQKLKDLVGRGESIDVDAVVVAPDEYNRYLERAYKAATIQKPRNAIGLAKSLPPAEMRQLLLAAVTLAPADVAALAEARATTVQKALAAKLEPGRVFVVAPKVDAAPPAQGSPLRVEFGLRD